MTRFELAASSSRTKRATGLRYIPKLSDCKDTPFLNIARKKWQNNHFLYLCPLNQLYTMKRHLLILFALFLSVSAFSQDKKEIIKKGWNFGPLPVVGFDADLGFQYGAKS